MQDGSTFVNGHRTSATLVKQTVPDVTTCEPIDLVYTYHNPSVPESWSVTRSKH